ncbi:uncharacterized protein METZ01_LOCUS445360, partial [marine metagenome]
MFCHSDGSDLETTACTHSESEQLKTS